LTAYPKDKTVRVEAPPIEEESPSRTLSQEMLSELRKKSHGEKRQK